MHWELPKDLNSNVSTTPLWIHFEDSQFPKYFYELIYLIHYNELFHWKQFRIESN